MCCRQAATSGRPGRHHWDHGRRHRRGAHHRCGCHRVRRLQEATEEPHGRRPRPVSSAVLPTGAAGWGSRHGALPVLSLPARKESQEANIFPGSSVRGVELSTKCSTHRALCRDVLPVLSPQSSASSLPCRRSILSLFPPCSESPKATSCFHLPHSPAHRCYVRPHFVLHLVPFERGQRRRTGEGGKGTAESGRGDRKAHEQQQQKNSTTR